MAFWVDPNLLGDGLDQVDEPVFPVTPVGKVKSESGPYINQTIWTVAGRKPNEWGTIELTGSTSEGTDFLPVHCGALCLQPKHFGHYLTDVDGMGGHGFRRCF